MKFKKYIQKLKFFLMDLFQDLNLMAFFEQYKFLIVTFISTGLLFLSPVFSVCWLMLTSFYLIYIDSFNLRDLGKIWFPTLFIWYIIFTQSMSAVTTNYIVIGSDYTFDLTRLMLEKDIWFPNLCFQTVFIFHTFSAKLNTLIYIPILPVF